MTHKGRTSEMTSGNMAEQFPSRSSGDGRPPAYESHATNESINRGSRSARAQNPPTDAYPAAPHTTSIPYPTGDDSTPNIIIFGESGIGKSSLINMIIGSDTAATSNEAVGCTFQSSPYDATLDGRTYRLWDTMGLNEGEKGTASTDRSIENLYQLIQNLEHGGVNLLVYCIRGSRIRDIIKINYDLFHKIICNQRVPIVLAVTGLENEENMEDWWVNNCDDITFRGMAFDGHACLTTTKGKRMKSGECMFEAEYEGSVPLARDLIVKYCPRASWKPDGTRWLGDIVQTMRQMFIERESQGHSGGGGNYSHGNLQEQSKRRGSGRAYNDSQEQGDRHGSSYGYDDLDERGERGRSVRVYDDLDEQGERERYQATRLPELPDFLLRFFQYIVMAVSTRRR